MRLCYHLPLLGKMDSSAQRLNSSSIHQKVPLSLSILQDIIRMLVKETFHSLTWRKTMHLAQAFDLLAPLSTLIET